MQTGAAAEGFCAVADPSLSTRLSPTRSSSTAYKASRASSKELQGGFWTPFISFQALLLSSFPLPQSLPAVPGNSANHNYRTNVSSFLEAVGEHLQGLLDGWRAVQEDLVVVRHLRLGSG